MIVKYTTILLILLGASPAFSQQLAIDSLRYYYFDEWVGKCGAETLVSYTETVGQDAAPLHRAYRGAGLATTANCTSWPMAKISRFRDGKKLLEGAVAEKPENLEVRFLRYTIQKNIPGFLGYDNLEEDRKFILDRLTLQLKSGKKDDLAVRILDYFYASGEFTREQIQDLEAAASDE
jgi:hypothetical protein